MKQTLPTCPACRTGQLHPATRVRQFSPRGYAVSVELQTSRCDQCGIETTRASQHKDNLARLAARKAQYGSVLMGEEILALRKQYGLTQQQASLLFGKGKIAFSRYENETTYPDDTTSLLLKLAIESPAVMKSLADKAHIEMPLWAARCEDEQRIKVRQLNNVPNTAPLYKATYVAEGEIARLGERVGKASAQPASVRQTVTLQSLNVSGQFSLQAVAA